MNWRAEKVSANKAKEFPKPPVEVKQACGGLLTLSALLGPSEMEKSSETISHMAGISILSRKVAFGSVVYLYKNCVQCTKLMNFKGCIQSPSVLSCSLNKCK